MKSDEEHLAEKYGNLLQWLDQNGAGIDVIEAYMSGYLFPVLPLEGATRHVGQGYKHSIEKLQRNQELMAASQPLLKLVQAELVWKLLKRRDDRELERFETRDKSLSSQEIASLLAITIKIASEFPGSSICILDSYSTQPEASKVRTRSAAVIWDGFFAESWTSRFARLKRLFATYRFILVGVTREEVEQEIYPGICSKLNERSSLWFDTSRIRDLVCPESARARKMNRSNFAGTHDGTETWFWMI